MGGLCYTHIIPSEKSEKIPADVVDKNAEFFQEANAEVAKEATEIFRDQLMPVGNGLFPPETHNWLVVWSMFCVSRYWE